MNSENKPNIRIFITGQEPDILCNALLNKDLCRMIKFRRTHEKER
jgi:hypothetical protein